MANQKQRKKRRRDITRRQREATRRNKISPLETTVVDAPAARVTPPYQVPQAAYEAPTFPTDKEIKNLSRDEKASFAFGEALASGDESALDRYFPVEAGRRPSDYIVPGLAAIAAAGIIAIAIPPIYQEVKSRFETGCRDARLLQKKHDQLPDWIRAFEERPEMPFYCFDGVDSRKTGGPAIK